MTRSSRMCGVRRIEQGMGGGGGRGCLLNVLYWISECRARLRWMPWGGTTAALLLTQGL